MKVNISFPSNGTQKCLLIENDQQLRPFFDKRISHEVSGDCLGEEWKGYVLKITGGNDKEGFPMRQGILTNKRVRLLMSKGSKGYRPRRTGERKRKSIRGCVVDSQLSVLALSVVSKGEKDIPGLTDISKPKKLGPKRASRIRKLFALDKKDDVKRYVTAYSRTIKKEGKKDRVKAPKVQRLVTPRRLQRKRREAALEKKRIARNKELSAEYAKLLAKRQKEQKEARFNAKQKRRLSSRKSESEKK